MHGGSVHGGSFNNLPILGADTRSLLERFEDFARRYPTDKDVDVIPAAKKLEEQIFARAAIKPEDINDTTVAPLIEELWEYPVS